jgi:hypothetical protein
VKNTRSQKSKSLPSDGVIFSDLEDIEDHRTFAIYGRPGTGKTTFAGSFPKPIAYIDIRDQGTASLRGLKGVKVKQLEDIEDLDEILRHLRKHHSQYKTVVLDTVSQLQQMAIEELFDGKQLKKGKRPGDWGTMTMQDWGTVTGKLKRLIIDFRDLADYGLNVVFLAQEKVSKEEADEKVGSGTVLATTVGPSVSGSVAEVLNAAVTVVGHTFNRVKTTTKEGKDGKKKKETKVEFCMRLGADPTYTTKVRKGRDIEVPSFIVDPTYDDLIAIINGE